MNVPFVLQTKTADRARWTWARWYFSLAAALALAVMMAPGSARAALITLTPSSDTIQVGETVSVDVVISDLPQDEIVSAFDLDLIFDPAVLSFSGISFGSGFGGVDDYFADGSISLANFNVVDFFLVVLDSMLTDNELFDLQGGGPVRLATLSFIGASVGFSTLAIDEDDPFLDVGGRNASPLAISGFRTAGVTVEATQVPEPGSLTLLTLCVAMVFALRRRFAVA